MGSNILSHHSEMLGQEVLDSIYDLPNSLILGFIKLKESQEDETAYFPQLHILKLLFSVVLLLVVLARITC